MSNKKYKALVKVSDLKERIDSLDTNDRNTVLRLAYNYNADTIGFMQNLSFTTVNTLQQMIHNANLNTMLGRKKLMKNATELLAPKFPHWTTERIREEIDYVLSYSTIYWNRLEWELNVIYANYIDNK